MEEAEGKSCLFALLVWLGHVSKVGHHSSTEQLCRSNKCLLMTNYDRPDIYFDNLLDFLIKNYVAKSIRDISSTSDRSMQKSIEAGDDEN